MPEFDPIPLEVLWGNPQRAGAQISPDGARLAYLAPLAFCRRADRLPAEHPGGSSK